MFPPPVAPPRPQHASYPAYLPDAEELENPFAGPSSPVWTWVRNAAVLCALFVATLFGRLLLDAAAVVSAPVAPRPSAAGNIAERVAKGGVKEPVSTVASAPKKGPNESDNALAPPDAPGPRPRSGSAHERKANERVRVGTASPNRKQGALRKRPSRVRKHRAREVGVERRVVAARPSETHRRARRAIAQAPSTARTSGSLRINSRPWSKVFVDGRQVGNTPLWEFKVAPGVHTVRLVNPDFGLSKTFKVRVSAGQTVKRVETLVE
ncbi:MAG: PEGA domain-containing protein [Myxococcales bacterium]|nr:PEGA domain-containing protein [Myxococcales bacterium]